ncbi:hypothetical protein N6H13_29830 [Paenibacillus sp. CC-CFT742]|nr:hypothetical protein [Paenibacillus sp. CC-CFT742]WJH29042.1 hypothetical protein N6H13_29830 [Paenibacillus sp. CC-CFT742]
MRTKKSFRRVMALFIMTSMLLAACTGGGSGTGQTDTGERVHQTTARTKAS